MYYFFRVNYLSDAKCFTGFVAKYLSLIIKLNVRRLTQCFGTVLGECKSMGDVKNICSNVRLNLQ